MTGNEHNATFLNLPFGTTHTETQADRDASSRIARTIEEGDMKRTFEQIAHCIRLDDDLLYESPLKGIRRKNQTC